MRYNEGFPNAPNYFNCTIQELKPRVAAKAARLVGFQLHHTGIKTWVIAENVAGLLSISIAPYRN